MNEYSAQYEEPENLPDGFKGVISTEFNTSEPLNNVSMNLSDPEGNPVNNYSLNSSQLSESGGTYFGGVLIPENSNLEGDYILEVVSLNSVEVDDPKSLRTENVTIGSSNYSILGFDASTENSNVGVELGLSTSIDSYVIGLEDSDGNEIDKKERFDPQGETIEEEAPGSYKDVDEVIKVSDELGIGEKVVQMKPIVCEGLRLQLKSLENYRRFQELFIMFFLPLN